MCPEVLLEYQEHFGHPSKVSLPERTGLAYSDEPAAVPHGSKFAQIWRARISEFARALWPCVVQALPGIGRVFWGTAGIVRAFLAVTACVFGRQVPIPLHDKYVELCRHGHPCDGCRAESLAAGLCTLPFHGERHLAVVSS